MHSWSWVNNLRSHHTQLVVPHKDHSPGWFSFWWLCKNCYKLLWSKNKTRSKRMVEKGQVTSFKKLFSLPSVWLVWILKSVAQTSHTPSKTLVRSHIEIAFMTKIDLVETIKRAAVKQTLVAKCAKSTMNPL